MACFLAAALLLCASSAQAQVVREEGFPEKGGVAEESVGAPGLQDECDPLAIPDEPGQGCAPWEREPEPFGYGPESEGDFLFPEAAGPPDREGEAGRQAPPRLECPAAVFLEELETGAIECHAWDASGEEHLDYFWEPAGSTTRNYLDNPLLIPEDSPAPTVIAPEAPAYETLESFLSGETTFRYRYRLTATSRATGLSSHEEVEVYVSSSRPSVYCPLEVVVQEGDTVALDCEGVDPLSSRTDYDEEAASVLWEWEGLWGTSTAPLAAADLSSPLFTAPPGSAGAEYHYIASMTTSASGIPRTARRRVTVRVVEGGEGAQVATDASAPANRPPIYLSCDGVPHDSPATSQGHTVHEGKSAVVSCSAWGAPGDDPEYTYAWTTRSGMPDAALPLLSDTDTSSVRFTAPEDVSSLPFTLWGISPCMRFSGVIWSCKFFTYLITVTADNADPAYKNIIFTVLYSVPPAPVITCNDAEVYEGAADFELGCTVTNEPSGASYLWAARDGTSDTSLLTDTDTLRATFNVPDNVNADTDYEYRVTLSASGIDNVTGDVTVTVLDTDPSIACNDAEVYEATADFELGCTASYEPAGTTYSWAAGDGTSDTSLLTSGTDGLTPTFDVPNEAGGSDKEYNYTVTMSSGGSDVASADVTVTVLEKPDINCRITNQLTAAYEGTSDGRLFICVSEWEGAPGANSVYTFAWTAAGSTPDTRLLSATNIESPLFYVPDAVDEDKRYSYKLTVSAENADDYTNVTTVRVINRPDITVACEDSGVYEGAADITLDCSVTNEPDGAAYSWAGTDLTNRLIGGTDGLTPTFDVPDNVNADTDYEYTVTLSVSGVDDVTEDVTVTVLNREPLAAACAAPDPVYEGSADVAFDCAASGAPSGSSYAYAWTARGDTPDTSLLSATDIASPTFLVPDEVAATTTYEYLLTVSAANAEDGSASVSVTVLNTGALAVTCADPGSVYEGSADVAFDCAASGAPAGSSYAYAWTARGDTQDTSLLSATDIASPTFLVPDEVAATTTYEYLLRVSAANAEDGTAEVAVTVLSKGALAVTCADPGSVYEGSADVAFDCAASGAPAGSSYAYAWTARGDTQDTSLLSATDIASPTFLVPDEVAATTTYEYLLRVSAANAEDGTAEVAVTVLSKGALAVTCADPGSVYEGSADVAFDCAASGAPAGSSYAYAWTARGDTQDTALLSATDIESPRFYVPDAIDVTTTYEYLLTVNAENAESGTAEAAVTVLDRIPAPPSDPVSPPVEEPPVEEPPVEEPPVDTSPPVASLSRTPSDPTALGVTVSASPLRFGAQSADTEVSLDPVTDGVSTYVSGPYHAGRMTLSPDGGEAFDENGEMDLSIELTSPVALKRSDAIGAASLVLIPTWSYAESCEQLSSQAVGGLYTEATLSEGDCRLLRFGGELDLAGAPPGGMRGI